MEKKTQNTNKKHSENADTSASVTFDLVVWPWPFVKVKKADVIRCCFLYYTLVSRTSEVYRFNVLRDITICLIFVNFDLHLWPSAFVKVTCSFVIRCISLCWMFVLKMKFVGSVEFKIWTFVWRKSQWRHDDVIPYLIFMKF